MSDKADISPLVGRHFVSRSGNVCRVARLGEGAVRASWTRSRAETTREDEDEFVSWAESVLGQKLDETRSRGREEEVENFRRWLRGERHES